MDNVYPSWAQVYQQALDGIDSEDFLERVYAVENAIHQRWPQLDRYANAYEFRAIEAANRRLLRLKTEILKWPTLIPAAPPAPLDVTWVSLSHFEASRIIAQ